MKASSLKKCINAIDLKIYSKQGNNKNIQDYLQDHLNKQKARRRDFRQIFGDCCISKIVDEYMVIRMARNLVFETNLQEPIKFAYLMSSLQ